MTEHRRAPIVEIHSFDEVQELASEAEEVAYWSCHSLGEEILVTMVHPPEGLLPSLLRPSRSTGGPADQPPPEIGDGPPEQR